VNSRIYWAGGLVEVRNARGDCLEWTADRPPPRDSESRATIRIQPREGAAPASEIRYYGLMRTIVEVPIELNDIPILER
jgi:hypothetical protein